MDGIGEKHMMIPLTKDSPTVSYIPFPRFLMSGAFDSLSAEAKILYVLMLDRTSISKVNGYINPDGSIRIYYTVEEVMKKLHRGKQCTTRVIKELERCNLICRKKQGQGKAAVITLNYPSDAKIIEPKEDKSG